MTTISKFLDAAADPLEETCLKFLTYNDVLRLRLVCTAFKNIAEKHLNGKRRSHTGITLDINFYRGVSQWSLGSFLHTQIPFPISNLNFIDSDSESDRRFGYEKSQERWEQFLETPDGDLDRFLDQHAPYFTHLSVQHLQLPLVDKKLIKIFNSFVGLRSLELCHLRIDVNSPVWREMDNEKKPIAVLPAAFTKLEKLSIKRVHSATDDDGPNIQDNLNQVFRRWIEKVTNNVETLQLPTSYDPRHLVPIMESKIKEKRRPFVTIDFYNCEVSYYPGNRTTGALPSVLKLFELCAESGTTIQNVHGDLFDGVNFTYAEKLIVQRVVRSVSVEVLKNIGQLLQLELPFSQKAYWNYQTLREADISNRVPIFCANLRGIGGFIWKDYTDDDYKNPLQFVTCHSRPNLEALDLKYWRCCNGMHLEIADGITQKSPNLKYICLHHTSANDDFFLKLWNGLPLLEHVALGENDVGDPGFIGADQERPAFCQLQRLKVFELYCLNKMERITGLTFQKVIPNMPNLRFLRVSDEPKDDDSFDENWEHLLSPPEIRFRFTDGPKRLRNAKTAPNDRFLSLFSCGFGSTLEVIEFNNVYINLLDMENPLRAPRV